MATKSYRLKESGSFSVRCSFLHPSNWRVSEMVEDDGCSWIYIAGPRSRSGLYSGSMTVVLVPSLTESIDEAATSVASRRSSFTDYRLMGKASGRIAERPALELEIVYSILLPLNVVNAKPVIIWERHVLLEYEGRALKLSYSASEDDYRSWLEAFRILVQTFSPSPPCVEMQSRPVIGGAWSCSCDGTNTASQRKEYR